MKAWRFLQGPFINDFCNFFRFFCQLPLVRICYKNHATSLTTSPFHDPFSPSSPDIIYGWCLSCDCTVTLVFTNMATSFFHLGGSRGPPSTGTRRYWRTKPSVCLLLPPLPPPTRHTSSSAHRLAVGQSVRQSLRLGARAHAHEDGRRGGGAVEANLSLASSFLPPFLPSAS